MADGTTRDVDATIIRDDAVDANVVLNTISLWRMLPTKKHHPTTFSSPLIRRYKRRREVELTRRRLAKTLPRMQDCAIWAAPCWMAAMPT
jgi:hypothetical protein